MNDSEKTKEQLISELEELRQEKHGRKQVEEKLRESEERFRQIVERSSDVFYRQNFDTVQFEYASPKVIDLLGITPEEMKSMNFEEQAARIHPNDLPNLIDFSKDLVEADNNGIGSIEREFRMMHKSGEYKWVRGSYNLTRDANGKPEFVVGGLQDITERKRAEEKLRESEQRFRTVADFTHDSEYWIDPDNNLIHQSPSIERITGYTAEEFIEKHPGFFSSIVHSADKEKFSKHFEKDLSSSEVTSFTFRIIRRSGEVRWIENMTLPIYDSEGKYLGRRGSSRDITERKRAEEKLKESEAMLSLAQSVGHIGNWSWNLQTNELFWSKENYRVFHIPVDVSPSYEVFEKTIHPEDREFVNKNVKDALEKNIPYNINFRIILPDNRERLVKAMAKVFYDKEDKPLHFLGTVQDITEHKLAEEALKESEKILRLTLDASSDGGWDWNIITGHVNYSDRWIKSLGYSKEEVVDNISFWQSIVHPDDKSRTEKTLNDHFNGKFSIYECENRLRMKTGEYRFNLDRGRVIERDRNGKPLRMIGTDTDITERKKMQIDLAESESMLQRSQEIGKIGSWEMDLSTNEIKWSDQLYKSFGLEKDENTNTVDYAKVLVLIHPDDRERAIKVSSDAIKEGKSYELEHRVLHPDGEIIVLLNTGDVIRNEKNEIVKIGGTMQDITERKKAEEQIKASLKEKETLLLELYHRTKNNMQVITSLLTLQSSSIKDEKVLQIFKDIKNRIGSMSLVHQKLYQSKDLSNIELGSYIEDLMNTLTSSYSVSAEKVRVKLDLERVSLSIDAAIPCGLILNEVISNSLKHAFPGDRKGELSVVLHAGQNGEVELSISDDGVGFPDDIDIGEPKSLGLQLIKDLVQYQLEGKVELSRDSGTGYHITFRTPRDREGM